MKIEFTLEENYQFFINETITRIRAASENENEAYYKFAIIFSATAIELGLILITRDLLKEGNNIYDKHGRTKPIKDIIEKYIKPKANYITNKHMRGFSYWDDNEFNEKNL